MQMEQLQKDMIAAHHKVRGTVPELFSFFKYFLKSGILYSQQAGTKQTLQQEIRKCFSE